MSARDAVYRPGPTLPRATSGDRSRAALGFRRKGETGPSGGAKPTSEVDAAAGESPRRALVCAACGHEVTRAEAAFSVAGSHTHTFMNPGGFVFEIACYREAPGVVAAGPSSGEWSWFPGHVWRVVLCGACRTHLGWSFRGEERVFFGLVRERITEAESPGEER